MMVILLFLLGVCIGSFLNVLVDRIPQEEGIGGRSHCEHCKKTLKWYDLIPLFSFLFLQGKCRYCRKKFSWYYPIVELTTGFVFAGVWIFFINQLPLFSLQIIDFLTLGFYLFLVSYLIVIFFADLKYGIIPDKIVYPAIITTSLFLILNSEFLILNSLLSAIGAFLFFLTLYLITKSRGIGFGDVKYAFFMGLLLGFPKIITGLYVAFLTGAAVSLILVLIGKKKLRGGTVAFGPFLVLGTFVALFWGKQLIDWFFGAFSKGLYWKQYLNY